MMNRDLRIVSEKDKAFYTLTLIDGRKVTMLKPTLEFYYRILEVKQKETQIETVNQAFLDGLDLIMDYMNTNVEGEKFTREDIMKSFTIKNVQDITGDIYAFAIGVDMEKNS